MSLFQSFAYFNQMIVITVIMLLLAFHVLCMVILFLMSGLHAVMKYFLYYSELFGFVESHLSVFVSVASVFLIFFFIFLP